MTKRKDLVRLLEENGFVNRGGAKHDRFEHRDGRWAPVPRHREIPRFTADKIKEQAVLK